MTFSIDTVAPETTILTAPTDPSSSGSASFTFDASETGSSFACQLDGGGYSACTSPKSYTGLADGSHTFEVRATDTAGNTDPTSELWTWTVDSTSPDTSITSAPTDPTNTANASFSFSASEAGSSFACQLDGGGYSACTSPKSYTGLADGSHTFQVRASDAAGNTDPTPASFDWTIDTQAPTLTLSTPADGTNVSDTTPAFSGNAGANAGDASTITITIYAGTRHNGRCRPNPQRDAAPAAARTAPMQPTPLDLGTYTARAEQSDDAGNTGQSSANTFTVDPAAPDIEPPSVSLVFPAAGSATGDATPAFSGTAGTDPGDSATVTVRVYSGSTTGGTLIQTLTATRGPNGAYSVEASAPLADGLYTGQAQQTDDAGNTGSSSANSFSVDTTAPGTTIFSAPADPSNTANASFSFSATEIGSSLACQLDGGGYSACTSPKSYTGLADGSHTFQVRASDAAGNTDPTPASFDWTIDATAPQITLTQPAGGASTGATPTFAGQAGTGPGDSATVTVRVYSGSTTGGTLIQTLTTSRAGGGAYSTAATSTLADGTYTAQAEQQDTAGNTGRSNAATFNVSTAPAGTSTYRTDVLSDGPAAYWRLGESAGTVAADEKGTSNGTYQNGVALGRAGVLTADTNTAVSFDGVDDIVTVPHSSSLSATSGVTLEAWVEALEDRRLAEHRREARRRRHRFAELRALAEHEQPAGRGLRQRLQPP